MKNKEQNGCISCAQRSLQSTYRESNTESSEGFLVKGNIFFSAFGLNVLQKLQQKWGEWKLYFYKEAVQKLIENTHNMYFNIRTEKQFLGSW